MAPALNSYHTNITQNNPPQPNYHQTATTPNALWGDNNNSFHTPTQPNLTGQHNVQETCWPQTNLNSFPQFPNANTPHSFPFAPNASTQLPGQNQLRLLQPIYKNNIMLPPPPIRWQQPLTQTNHPYPPTIHLLPSPNIQVTPPPQPHPPRPDGPRT